MSILVLKEVSKRFRRGDRPAIEGLNFEVKRGEIFTLLGESGSGKTTTLRIIAGLEVPSAGTVTVDSRKVAGPADFVPPEARRVGMVFQDNSLFPHLDLERNIVFSGSIDHREVSRALQLVGLTGYEKRYPHQLSGGQRQRAELARALVSKPVLLLLDEPFSNLDETLKRQLRADVAGIIRKTGTTAILVTHDVEDAMAMSDRMAVFCSGKVCQIGTPRDLYEHPNSCYVARLLGTTNLIAARTAEAGFETDLGFFPCPRSGQPGRSCTISIRPEHFRLGGHGGLEGTVEKVTFMGGTQEVIVKMGADQRGARLTVSLPANRAITPGDNLQLEPCAEAIQIVES